MNNVVQYNGPKRAAFFPVRSLQRDIDSLFDRFFEGPQSPLKTESNEVSTFSPQLDIAESDDAFHLALDLPGVDDKNLSLDVEDDVLVIRATREQQSEQKERHYHRVELSYGTYERRLQLPETIDIDAIDARFKQGVLDIDLPKREIKPAQKRQIKIKQK